MTCDNTVLDNNYYGSGGTWNSVYNSKCAAIAISATNKNFIHHATIEFILTVPNDSTDQCIGWSGSVAQNGV